MNNPTLVRQELKAAYDQLTDADRSQRDRQMTDLLAEWLTKNKVKDVFLYKPANKEPDLFGILAKLPELKYYVPVLKPGDNLEFYLVGSTTDFAVNFLGMYEPILTPDIKPTIPDRRAIVIYPSLAADLHGNRVGYGLGAYKKLNGFFTAITAVYHEFLLSEIPLERPDCTMDFVLTESLMFECAGS